MQPFQWFVNPFTCESEFNQNITINWQHFWIIDIIKFQLIFSLNVEYHPVTLPFLFASYSISVGFLLFLSSFTLCFMIHFFLQQLCIQMEMLGIYFKADLISFLFCYVIDLVSEQEILRGHPSLQAAAELNLLTHCFQSFMQDSGYKYWMCKQLFKLAVLSILCNFSRKASWYIV